MWLSLRRSEEGALVAALAGKVSPIRAAISQYVAPTSSILPDQVLQSNSGDLLVVLILAVHLTRRKHETCRKTQKWR